MIKTPKLKLSEYSLILAYLILIVFSPSFHFISHIEYHDSQRVLQLLLLLIVLLDVVFSGLTIPAESFLNGKLKFGFFCLILFSIASAYQAIVPRYALIEVTVYISLFYLSLSVARLYSANSNQFIKLLTFAFWVSIALYMLSFYTGYITAIAVGKKLVWPYPFYGFSNIRLFQQYQLWGIGLICLPLLALNVKNKVRPWLYVGLTLWWILLYYAASRGVMLSWIVATLLTAAVYQKLAWPFLRIQLINAATGLLGYFVLFKAIPNWITSSAIHATNAADTTAAIVTSTIFRSTTFDRLDLWKAAYVMIKNFPIFGVGPMHFYFYTPHGTHPHNSILQIAAEFGLPATLILLLIVSYSFYHWMINFNAQEIKTDTILNKSLSIILFFTFVANMSYSLVEGVIIMPISQVMMFTVIGLMTGQFAQKQIVKDQLTYSKKKNVFRLTFVAFTFILLLLSTMPEVLRGLTNKNRVLQNNERAFSMGPNIINPRIWMQQRRVERQSQ